MIHWSRWRGSSLSTATTKGTDVSQIRSGILLSFLSIFLTNGISLLFTPYMLAKLGQANYGLYILVGSLISYLGLVTFGMGSTLVRYIARYRAVSDTESEENLLAMALIVYTGMSALVLLAGGILWFLLPGIFPKLTAYELSTAKIMFALLVASTAFTLPSAVFSAVQTAYERFSFPRVVMIASGLLRTAVLFALLYQGYSVVAIVVVDVLLNVLVLLLNLYYVFVGMKVRIRLHHFNVPLLKELFLFSFWIFLNLVMDQLYWKFGQTVLGMTTGTSAVAVFAIGIQLAFYFLTLSTAISGVFLPRAAAMDARNASNEELTSMMIRVGRYQLLIMGLALIGFINLGRLFILNWLGAEYLQAWAMSLVIIIPLLIPLIQNFGISILQAKNKHAARSVIYVAISMVNVVIGYFLSLQYGGLGMAIAISLSLFMGQGIAINLYYHYRIGLNIPRFFREILSGLLPGLVVSGTLGYLTSLLPGDGWQGLFLKGLLIVLIYIASMWLFGMNTQEKAEFASMTRKLLIKTGLVREIRIPE